MLLEASILQELLDPWKYKGGVILDVGCGKGRFGHLLGSYSELLVGCDLHHPYLRWVKKKVGSYDDVVRCDSSKLPFRDKCFNASVSVEVIEHLPKEKGFEMLSEMERVSLNLVVVVTPNVEGPGETEPQLAHKSSWKAKDFKKLGYVVRGSGFKYSSLVKRSLKVEVGLVVTILSFYLTPLATILNAWKYLKKPY